MQISLRKLFLLFIFLFFSVVGFKGKTSLVPDAKYFKKLFDYNPMYKGLEGAITDSIALHGKPEHHHETIVIPLHGFGETSPGGWDVRFSVKKNNESIDIARTISFGFKDTKLMKYLDDFQKAKAAKKAGMVILQGLLLKLAKAARDINIGQTLDAEVALYPLIELARFGYKGTVVFFAHSRGGTTLIRLLDMVANPQNYKKTWKKFGITPKRENKKIKKIYEMLQKGKHFLVHPLLDLGLALKKIGEGNLIKSGLLVPVMKAGLMVGTKYTFKLKQPIEILEHLSTQEEQFNLHFILTYPDDMVTNELDGKLKQLVDKTNGSWMVDIWKKKELKEKRIAEIVKVMLRNEALKLAQTNEIAKKYVRENIDAYIENTIFNFKMKAKEKKLKRKLSNQEKLDLLREYLKNRHKAKLRAEIAKLLKDKTRQGN